LAISEDFAGGFVLPVSPLLHRPVEGHRAGAGTIVDAAAAVPALIGVEDNGRFAFLRVRDINIYLADFYAVIAAVADLGVENDGLTRRGDVGQSVYFF
jgi:hypothetical protein